MTVNKHIIIKWLTILLWTAIGMALIVLLVAAVKKKNESLCSSVQVSIIGVSNNFFVDKKDILNAITHHAGGTPVGRPIGSFDLKAVEETLEKNIWVDEAKLFFDNNNVLQVKVYEREPVARVFTLHGETFYLDSTLKVLPLSDKYCARLPVFSSFPADSLNKISKNDSLLLRDVLNISMAINKDPFIMALIDQVDITPARTFEMVPKIGKNIIVFGDGTAIEDKFIRLKTFYKNILVKSGLDYYSVINVGYTGQIVAKRKGAEDVQADSMRALQIMRLVAANAERMSADSMQLMIPDNDYNTVDSSLIMQSLQREEEAMDGGGSVPVRLDTVQKRNTTPANQPKPIQQVKPVAVKPKAVAKPKTSVVQKPVTTKTNNEY